MIRRNSVPKSGRKWYHRGYYNGIRAGKMQQAEQMVDKFKKNYPKIAAHREELKKEYFEEATAQQPITLPDNNSIKWQGFTEAMNLIIASKR